MKYRNIFLLTISLLLSLPSSAQELTVKDMKATNDLSASQYRRKDLAGEACALVKVQLATTGATFEGNVIQPVEYKPGEYWVYMSNGSRELRIKHPSFVPLHVNFSDYGIKGVQSLTTYDLTLIMPQGAATVQTQKLIIDYTPTNAIVVVDSKPHQGNGHLELTLPVGSHEYQIVAMGYDTVEGSVKLNASSPSTIKLTATQQQTANPTAQPVQPSTSVAQNTDTKSAEDPEIKGKTPLQIRNLGFDYQNGTGGKAKDYAKAMKYARIAAERGNTDAMVDVGNMYRLGYGVEKNQAEAVKWFRKAAEQGNADAQYNLGYSYVSGNGIEKNQAEALKWYRKAADQGIAKAQTILGLYYHQKGDTAQAKDWYEKAAAQGDEEAKKQLSELKKLSSVNPQTSAPQLPSAASSGNSIETITVKGVSFNMVRVDGGTFTMGATSEQGSDAYSDEKPAHQVTLSTYSIGETEVTQDLWQAVMGSNPSRFKGNNKPVERVSWEDCQTFISKLNQLTGRRFRLPTEAEWEYAARGGSKSRGNKYSGSNNLDDVAWYWENSGDQRLSGNWDSDKITQNNCRTHDVKTKQANELGLYDMSGNVYEWCQDWKANYSSDSQTNPAGPSSGSNRVRRGGSWNHFARYCRVSNRSYYSPGLTLSNLGLRLAL